MHVPYDSCIIISCFWNLVNKDYYIGFGHACSYGNNMPQLIKSCFGAELHTEKSCFGANSGYKKSCFGAKSSRKIWLIQYKSVTLPQK